MVVALNCLHLGDTFDDIIKVNVGEKFVDNDVEIKISEATISDLKMLIWRTKKELNESMKLWKVELEDENKLKDVVTEEDIEKKLNGKKMNPLTKFIDEKNFPVSYKPPHDKVHIIIVVSTTEKQTVKTVKDAINIVLKMSIADKNIIRPKDELPFMERNTDREITRIEKNIGNNLKGSTAKTDFNVLVSGGAPGIGKTRFGQEIFKHLENGQNWVPPEWKNNLQLQSLYLDFGNGCKLDSYDDQLTPTVIIGLRIAYVFFIEKKYIMKFETFRGLVWEYREIFNMSNVFVSIYDHLIQPNHTNRQLFVFLHIDEFQLIDEWEFNAVKERDVPVKQLFKEMINGIATYMLGPASLIYVQTFLSGTAPQVVISAKKSSRVSFEFANCPQLSFKALLNIADHYAQKHDAEKFKCGTYKWMLCQPFLQLLQDTGGLPRAIQYVFEVCFEIEPDGKKFFDNIHTHHYNTFFYNVKQLLQVRYNIYGTIEKNKKLALELLYHSIDAIPVELTKCLDPNDERYTIENLERDAHIILNRCNETSSEFTIKMPFFFLCLYNDKLKIIDFNLEETLRVQNTMHWQDWEFFVAYYEAFRTNLLIERGKRTVCLKELYRGVNGIESVKNIEVRLKKLSVRQAQEQFPCSKLTEKGSAEPIPWEEGEFVIINGMSAEWGDSFRVLETVQGDRLLSIHQNKYDDNSATYTLKDLLDEHDKNIDSSSNTTKNLFDKLAKYRHITIVFTTQPFYEKVSHDDCFIISRNNFEEYFGPVFSSRATFALTKDINPNFSVSQRIMECLPGKVTAAEIIKNRPYKSEDAFFEKLQRAKRGIEEQEREKPEKKQKIGF